MRTIYKNIIACNLRVGEHLKRIRGLDHFKIAYDYVVLEEYTHHYLIGIKYMSGLVPEGRNYICISISKAAIYCGSVVLIKEDGRRVEAYQKEYAVMKN